MAAPAEKPLVVWAVQKKMMAFGRKPIPVMDWETGAAAVGAMSEPTFVRTWASASHGDKEAPTPRSRKARAFTHLVRVVSFRDRWQSIRPPWIRCATCMPLAGD